jgi:hypothetical protein
MAPLHPSSFADNIESICKWELHSSGPFR